VRRPGPLIFRARPGLVALTDQRLILYWYLTPASLTTDEIIAKRHWRSRSRRRVVSVRSSRCESGPPTGDQLSSAPDRVDRAQRPGGGTAGRPTSPSERCLAIDAGATGVRLRRRARRRRLVPRVPQYFLQPGGSSTTDGSDGDAGDPRRCSQARRHRSPMAHEPDGDTAVGTGAQAGVAPPSCGRTGGPVRRARAGRTPIRQRTGCPTPYSRRKLGGCSPRAAPTAARSRSRPGTAGSLAPHGGPDGGTIDLSNCQPLL
jgi:hypothetical protein